MAAVNGLPLPFRLTLEETSSSEAAALESESSPTDAVLFVGVSLVLGIACRHLLRGTRVPYTVALLILGIALGSLEYGTKHGVGRLGDGIRIWENINPDLLLAVFLPALLFESSFSMEIHQIKRCIWQMVLLAGPGVLLSTFCLGAALKVSFPYDWNWTTSLLLGRLLSATDPVAVVALLKELGASKKLSTIIEGESLMNDGTAIVIYQLFFQMVLGKSFGWAEVLKFLVQVALGAVAVGIAFGIASVVWIRCIFNDTVIEITLTLAVSYIAYFTAQEEAGVSGVLTVMTLGMFYAAAARTAFKGEGLQSLHHFWEMVAYIANTLIFILSGCLIAEGVLSNGNLFKNSGGVSWGYLVLLYVYVQVSRTVVVGALFPLLQYFGYGFNWKEAIILIWSGLRGAVALSLSLSVKRSSGGSSTISSETGTLFLFFTGGIVFLTLIVNGSTVQFVLRLLGMNKLSAAKRRILEFTKYEMHKKALEAFGDPGEDEDLGPADWPTVKKYLKCLDNVEGERLQLHDAAEPGDTLDPMSLADIRVRLLSGVQAAYWDMLDEGRITQSTANILMQSVDEALDSVTHEPLCDWRGLKSQVHFPNYYKLVQMSIPCKLVTYFTVERLETACYICAAFLRAHRTARQQLIDFIGDSEYAAIVILESEAEAEEARNFLEDVRETFPQVLRAVKTRQVIHAVLTHLIEYVIDLEKSGILEEKEMLHLHDAVQTDLRRVLRNPPMVKVPKIGEMISTHPLLGALPDTARDVLVGSTKEIVKPRGMSLYKEGSKPSGIWLISNGNVKWSSKNIRSKHALHPTFTHGSTLGLYEVLTSKPYICDMITESVVFCFYIETEKIQGVLSAYPAVEDFLWKESIIVLSKILTPRVFEKIPVHDLRLLISERSTITTFLRGETIEAQPHSVCILLEGFVKSHGHELLITPPAALIPPNPDLILRSQEGAGIKAGSNCYIGTLYHVESRAKVMVLDMASLEIDKALKRRQSSIILQKRDSATSINPREHSGLLSWPDHRFEAPAKQDGDAEELDYETNNLSARARQLSMFGSMVGVPRRAQSFKRGMSELSSHSLSFPRVPSTHDQRGLTTVRSEGSTTLGKMSSEGDSKRSTLPTIAHSGKPSLVLDLPSDGSGGEEDVIVRIDSPSGLTFRQAP
uniref:Na+/H+ antiporter protein n=1 Tax=Limonium gmelinii TaxID=46094 RepID=B3VN42_9CARY|nr:Na+/H+ antiporter protein [Limonium gmelinii]